MIKRCGIYKITSPSSRIYIGQSRDIKSRFKRYKKSHISNKTQVKLDRSFIKYGVENHVFEIIEECEIENLNVKERYWQDYYNVINKGLNCILTETDVLPRVITKEHREKISGKNHWCYNKKMPKEAIDKMKKAKIGTKASNETKRKLSEMRKGEGNNFYGKLHSVKSKEKQSESAKNRKINPENEEKRRSSISKALSKKVVQLDLGGNLIQEYDSLTIAAKALKTNTGSICNAIKGLKVKTHKGYIWEYK